MRRSDWLLIAYLAGWLVVLVGLLLTARPPARPAPPPASGVAPIPFSDGHVVR